MARRMLRAIGSCPISESDTRVADNRRFHTTPVTTRSVTEKPSSGQMADVHYRSLRCNPGRHLTDACDKSSHHSLSDELRLKMVTFSDSVTAKLMASSTFVARVLTDSVRRCANRAERRRNGLSAGSSLTSQHLEHPGTGLRNHDDTLCGARGFIVNHNGNLRANCW